MAIKLRRRARKHAPHRLIRAGDRTMTFVPDADDVPRDGVELPSAEEVDAALRDVPEDLSWDWVAPRLIPLFERGYAEGFTGDPMLNAVSSVGVGIGFGIDFGPVIGRVTQSMAQRWEASIEQIEHAAFVHLAAVVGDIGPGHVQTVVDRGHFFRALGHPEGWASSVILAGEAELIRIFRTRDAMFTAPTRNSLLAFPPATPVRAVADITVHLEAMDPHPLLIDPFVMEGGVLRWEGVTDSDERDAD